MWPDKSSIDADYALLEKYSPEIADDLIENPDTLLKASEEAIAGIGLVNQEGDLVVPKVRFFNLPQKLLIRNINSGDINKLISIEGVINKITDVRPKIEVAVFECVHDGRRVTVDQRGELFGKLNEPGQCPQCGRSNFKLLLDEAKFIDMQKMQVQEPLEALVRGEQAKNINIWMEGDLTNKLFAGDKVEITGILRLIPPKYKSSVYSLYLHAIHIQQIEREFEEIEVSEEEEEEIKKLAADPEIYKKIIGSIAPSIYGNTEIKEALALQLFGGSKNKVLPDGVKIRPDIHILLIGDPGTAKSQLLYYIYKLAPKGVFVGGKSATGAGLCVAPDSLITLNDAGMHEIGEFIESQEFDANEEMPYAFSSPHVAKVLSLDKELKTAYNNSTKIWKIKAPKELVRITTTNGKELTLTPNTPLLALTPNGVAWKKSSKFSEGEYIATSRKTPKLKGKEIPAISLIENKNVKIGNNASRLVTLITNRLAEKHGSIEGVAKAYGLKRDRLYRWRSKRWYQAADLQTIKRMALDAGMEYGEIAKDITALFNRYGTEIHIKPFLTKELACLAGLIAGDGDIQSNGNSASIRFHNTDPELLRKASKCIEAFFGIKPKLTDDGERVANIRTNSIIIAEVLERLGVPSGKKSARITVPSCLSSSKYLASYLQALFDCDGYVSQRKTHGSSTVGLTTTSKQLAHSVQLLLEQWGIISRIRIRDKRHYTGKIRSRLIQYELVVSGQENLALFEKHIGFSIKEKKGKLRGIINGITKRNTNKDIVPGISEVLMKLKKRHRLTEKQLPNMYCKGERKPSRQFIKKIAKLVPDSSEKQLLKMLAENDIFWDRIKEKGVFKNKGLEWVYDFTIPNSHAFLANGVFVHNTATAEKDEFGEGGWTLKAGALVLASGGMAAIDEFDKMGDEDRSAMHEAMEQQRISIAKAGIVTTFKSETSILAAANPKYGRFDPYTPAPEQFNIPPTLLSRFDLIFPIKDVLDEARDRAMAEHILTAHQASAIRGNSADGILTKKELEEAEAKITPIVEPDLMRKYIAYSRKYINPVLTQEAMDKVEQYYVELRGLSNQQQGTVAITARQLEALVRLAEASARERLSNRVELGDAERAIRLHQFVMQKIGIDKETGRFDIDIIATGQSKSKMDKVRSLYSAIKSLTKEYDVVTRDMIVDEAKNVGIEPKEIDSLLVILKKNGDVYSPKHGQFRTAENR